MDIPAVTGLDVVQTDRRNEVERRIMEDAGLLAPSSRGLTPAHSVTTDELRDPAMRAVAQMQHDLVDVSVHATAQPPSRAEEYNAWLLRRSMRAEAALERHMESKMREYDIEERIDDVSGGSGDEGGALDGDASMVARVTHFQMASPARGLPASAMLGKGGVVVPGSAGALALTIDASMDLSVDHPFHGSTYGTEFSTEAVPSAVLRTAQQPGAPVATVDTSAPATRSALASITPRTEALASGFPMRDGAVDAVTKELPASGSVLLEHGSSIHTVVTEHGMSMAGSGWMNESRLRAATSEDAGSDGDNSKPGSRQSMRASSRGFDPFAGLMAVASDRVVSMAARAESVTASTLASVEVTMARWESSIRFSESYVREGAHVVARRQQQKGLLRVLALVAPDAATLRDALRLPILSPVPTHARSGAGDAWEVASAASVHELVLGVMDGGGGSGGGSGGGGTRARPLLERHPSREFRGLTDYSTDMLIAKGSTTPSQLLGALGLGRKGDVSLP
ncbi:hypothetical protein EON62_03660, partial [archaeon]